jgi:hypothetical protein
MAVPETLEILEKLNSLYSGAISQVVSYTIGLVAFVGLLIPVAIGILQNRQLKNDHKSLTATIEAETKAIKQSLLEEVAAVNHQNELKLQQLVKDTTTEIRQELLKLENQFNGKAFHLQARSVLVNHPSTAASSALQAITCYARSEDERNIAPAMAVFMDGIAKINGDQIAAESLDEVATTAIAALKKLDGKGRYSSDIQDITDAMRIAKTPRPKSEKVAS